MSENCYFVILWARSERYQRPHFVIAFAENLADGLVEEFDAKIAEAKQWWVDFGNESDGPWVFWTTHESIGLPVVPERLAQTPRYD